MTAAVDTRVRPNAFTVDVEDWFHICGAGADAGAGSMGSTSESRSRDDPGAARRSLRRARSRDVLRAGLGRRTPSSTGRRDRRRRARNRVAWPLAHACVRARRRTGSSRISGEASRRFERPERRAFRRIGRLNGRSTTDRCGRSKFSRARASRRTRAWRHCGSWAVSTIHAIRTSGRRQLARSSSSRHLSRRASGRLCRSAGAGASG